MLLCDHIVSVDDFIILATSDSDFHIKVKEGLLISRDEPILNKNETSLLFSTYLIDPSHMKLYFNIYCSSYCTNIAIVS